MEPARAGPASGGRKPRRNARCPGARATAAVPATPACGSAAAAGGRAEEIEAPRSEEAVGIEPCRRAEAAAAWERVIRAAPLRSSAESESPMPLVLTPLAQRVLQKLRCAYTSRRRGVRPPVLLHGPPGSGKSSYIRWLSQLMGMKQPPVCLFLDQQTEAKSLVGSWVCGRRAGEFEWQDGILSRCVREGRWVVIEQLQQLAHDVHALLHSLAATGYLEIHEQQRRVRAHPNFALFATLAAAAPWRLRKGAADKSSAASALAEPQQAEAEALDVALTRPPPQLPALLESWVLLHVPAPSFADVQRIACRAFPSVSPVVLRLLRSFQAASAVATSGLSRSGQPPSKAVRLPQLRDFLKLCRRLERLSNSSSGSSSSLFGGFLTDRLRLRIVEEGVAVLLAHIGDRALRYRAAVAFAEEWGVQDDQVEAVLFAQRPSLRESEAWLHVGPYYSLARCSRGEEASGGVALSSKDVNDLLAEEATAATPAAEASKAVECEALTGQQLRLLQQAAGALSCGEPLLLVGDTGAGKTFIVSFVAAKVGVELVTVNLHQQSESEDLLGRWVPRHPPQEAITLWRRLNKLAGEMLDPPSGANEEGGVDIQLEAADKEPNAKKRKQQGGLQHQQQQPQDGDRLIGAARLMVRQLQQRGARLIQREAYVALLRLALAANTALLQLLRKAGDRLPAIPLQHPPQQQQRRRTVGELLAACKEIQTAGLALLEDPALNESSAPTPRNFSSMVEACGLRDFLPLSGAPHTLDEGEPPQSAPRRRTRCQLHFAFTDGPLVEAVRTGKWLLLDEINLGPPDLLQRLLALLDGPEQPLLVLHGGRPKLVSRHPNFRVFACMNPPTLAPPFRLAESKMSFEEMEEEALVIDKQQQQQQQQQPEQKGKKQSSQEGMCGGAGKRELPAEVRQRFTELYVDETDGLEDITTIADAHLRPLAADPPSRLVAELYIHLRCLAESGQLLDGNNKTPCYSLRTLSRALQHAAAIVQRELRPLQLRPALSEGFAALFGSSLNQQSAARLEAVLVKAFRTPRPTSSGGATSSSSREVAIELLRPSPGQQPCVSVEGFLIRKGTALQWRLVLCVYLMKPLAAGPEAIDVCALKKNFVLTPRGQVYLHRIARLLSGSRCALLLEGPTSCGKTSVVSFLAAATGHKCVRINNHEHTDIQEYLGSYAPDAGGRLVFSEGPLTLAVRHGWWVLIDELNLAPSEVLEALNRLLDGNRELVLPTTGEVLKAHADFQLFGTQNPAGVGLYGGRKVLSKALANRFLQLQLEEFGLEDLRLILLSRCKLPASRVEPMLKVFCDLQQRRAKSSVGPTLLSGATGISLSVSVFFGAHGFMTIRDLIRWGRRVGNSPFQHHLQQQQQQRQQQQHQQQQEEAREFSPTSLEELALEGWLLVGERLRTEEERAIVKDSLERHCLKSTAAKPKRLSVDYSVDPYVVAFRRLLAAKMDWCSHQQKAAAEATAAAAAAAARVASLKSSSTDAALLEEAETAAAAAVAAAEGARAAAPDLPSFLPFSFNAASSRLLALTLRALAASENLLLVGETGAGKTAVCELVAWTLQPPHPLQQQKQEQQQQQHGLEYLLLQRLSPSGLYAYNCHLQMEASELLGCMHPVHQGELQQQQHEASLKQLELLRLLEDAPEPELLVPDWLSQLQSPESPAAAAAETTASGEAELKWGDRLERRRGAALSQLHRFHASLQSVAEDVLICLRAARHRSQHPQQQRQHQQPPLGEDDACLFSRALRKAAKSAAQQFMEELRESLDKALQREKNLQADVLTAQQQLQQQQAELVRVLSQEQRREEPEARHEDAAVLLSGQEDSGGQRQQQQQERQSLEEDGGTARKRQRKGGRNRALRLEETAAAPDKPETVQKRRRKKADTSEAAAPAAAAASCSPLCAAGDDPDTAAAAAIAAAAAAAAAVEEGKQQVARLVAESAAAVAEREDLEAGGVVVSSLVKRLIQQVQLAADEWVCACKQTRRLFCWKDGPLVRAMKEGALFLLDEASLSQDAVLERLNSVLEDERHLLLTEQGAAAASNAADAGGGLVAGGEEAEAAAAELAVVDVVASPAFRFVATMNPGGDYGKRELSPALRNRLTEVYVPAFSFDASDAALLLLQRLRHTRLWGLKLGRNLATAKACCGGDTRQQQERQLQSELLLLQQQQPEGPDFFLTLLAVRLVLVLRWVKKHVKQPLSIRDAICWICFIDRFVAAQWEQRGEAGPAATDTAAAAATAKWVVQGFIHGGCLLLLDGLGVGAEMQLNQKGLVSLADDYLSAEGALLEGADVPLASENQQQQTQHDWLAPLREQLRQQLDDASEQPARRPQLAVLWLLLTHACRLYSDFGLQAFSDNSSTPQKEQQWEEKQQQPIARAPSWSETRAAFGTDGFAWVVKAFTSRPNLKPLKGGAEAAATSLQIGPFNLAAYTRRFTPQRGAGWEVQPQTVEELTQVVDSPSVQRSLGRLLRCLLLIRQPQRQHLGKHEEKGEGTLNSSINSGRHAVLLEGPPGAGKTFVVNLLARLCGRRLVRINLSEDTELADLIGSFVPAAAEEALKDGLEMDDPTSSAPSCAEQGNQGAPPRSRTRKSPFVWADGVLTRHLKAGNWVLLDELNLAPQQTLEGLNPLLDHRRCIYLPTADDATSSSGDSSNCGDASKKGTAVHAPPGFVLFATQNPHATATAARLGSSASPVYRQGAGQQQQQQEEATQQQQGQNLSNVFDFLGLPESIEEANVAPPNKRLVGFSESKAVGGRKGLPQSLLNRFCRIRIDEMLESDMVAVARKLLNFLHSQQQKQLRYYKQQDQVEEDEEHDETKQGQLQKAVERQQSMLSVCTVRCVRLMGELGSRRPFKGLGDCFYNLRDVARLIRMIAYKLPCADPRASVAVALMSRLRCADDLAAAASLVARCFPRKLIEILGGQERTQRNQEQQQNKQVELDCVAALLCPLVAPAAVLSQLKDKPLPVSARHHTGLMEGALPLDLLLLETQKESRLSLGGVELIQRAGAPVLETFEAAREPSLRVRIQQHPHEQEERQCGLLLHSQRRCVVALAAALKADFPVLLTGERGEGKSSIVRWLAAAWGADVCEVQLAPSIDTSDLLGFYRQVQPRQRLLQAAQDAEQIGRALIQVLQRRQEQRAEQQLVQQQQQQICDVLGSLEALVSASAAARQRLAKLCECAAAEATRDLVEQENDTLLETQQQEVLQRLAASTKSLLGNCEAAAPLLPLDLHSDDHVFKGQLSVADLTSRCRKARMCLQEGCAMSGRVERLSHGGTEGHLASGNDPAAQAGLEDEGDDAPHFEWVDSVLVDAVREGRWLLLRDSHLCSPSVLDRLNALLEDGGSLLLTEGGSPRLVKRHPSFRVIFTADAAKVHLLSAALRNRCCEVYLRPSGFAGRFRLEEQASGAACGSNQSAVENIVFDHSSVASEPSPAPDSCRLLLQGLTDRLLRTLAQQLQCVAKDLDSTPGQRPHNALLVRWAASLIAGDAEASSHAQHAVATLGAAVAVLHVFGAYIEFFLARSSKAGTRTTGVRLCPLLLQDAYRLLLAGDAGTGQLSRAAAEAMALHHAAMQVLLHMLAQESMLAAFGASLVSAQPLQEPQGCRQQQRRQQQYQQESDIVDTPEQALGTVKAVLGEATLLTGLQGLQCLAKRVSGDHGAASAAAASWRCLQGWGGAYAAACAFPAKAENFEDSAQKVEKGPSPSKAVEEVSLDTLFQCFLWQYTAVIEGSGIWRLVLLHLLASCCCCCSSLTAAAPSSSGDRQLVASNFNAKSSSSEETVVSDNDWTVLRGAVERLTELQQSRRASCFIGKGIPGDAWNSEVSLLTSAFYACDSRGEHGVALLAAFTRHFLWAAANPTDLERRLHLLQQLQRWDVQVRRLPHQAARGYVEAACEAMRQDGKNTMLLPPAAAAAIESVALGPIPAHGESLLYAAARLARLSRSGSFVAADEEPVVLLLQPLVRLLCHGSIAMLLPERLQFLRAGRSMNTRERARCAAGIHGAACRACGVQWRDDPCCLFSVLVAERGEEQLPSAFHDIPRTMGHLYKGLQQLTEQAVSAATAALLSGAAGAPACAAGGAQAAELCARLTRVFRAWTAALQLLCLPLCGCSCEGTPEVASAQRSNSSSSSHWSSKNPGQRLQQQRIQHRLVMSVWQQLNLRIKALIVSLGDIAVAQTQEATNAKNFEASGDSKRQATSAGDVEVVAADLLPPISHLYSALLFELRHEDVDCELVKPQAVASERGTTLLFSLEGQQQRGQVHRLASLTKEGAIGGALPLLPASELDVHARSVGGWLLRDILQALALGAAPVVNPAATEPAAAGIAADGFAKEQISFCEQQPAALVRRFGTSAPALGRGQDLLRLAIVARGEGSVSSTSLQREETQKVKPCLPLSLLPQPRLVLPHASALLALLLSSSVLRAGSREESAEKLEAQVAEFLLPAFSTSCSPHNDAELLRSSRRAAVTAAAARAAAAAEGVLQSRSQHWIGLSRLAMVSVSILQAQLAARAAVCLGVEHAAELFLLHLECQLEQLSEPTAAAAEPKVAPAESVLMLELPLALERAAQEQMLRQQFQWLPLFTSPAAAFSPSLEDTVLGQICGSLGASLPVPPALLEATALLTASSWKQRQHQQQQQDMKEKKRDTGNRKALGSVEHTFLAAAGNVAVETLCCMWRTEVDVYCNDALQLHQVLQLQENLQENKAADACVGAAQTASLLNKRTWSCLADAVGGLRGAAACTAGRAVALTPAKAQSASASMVACGSCAYTVRIVAEVQQHATVSSAGSCFLALQRLRQQLRHLDEDGCRGAARLLNKLVRTGQPSDCFLLQKKGETAADSSLVTWSDGLLGDAAEWAAALGFCCFMWSSCPPELAACLHKSESAQTGDRVIATEKAEETGDPSSRKRASSCLLILRVLNSCWQSLWMLLCGSSAAPGAVTSAAEELRRLVVEPLHTCVAAADAGAASAGAPPTASEGRTDMRLEATRSAVASLSLLFLVLNRCSRASNPDDVLRGASGMYVRGLLLLLLGRWAVLSAAASVAADLEEQKAVAAWRLSVKKEITSYETERDALLLRAAAVDGCDGGESLAAVYGPATSASTALVGEVEAHTAALQRLLDSSREAGGVLKDVSRLLPLRLTDIPVDLATRLTKPYMRVPSDGAVQQMGLSANAAAAAAVKKGAAGESRTQVLHCLSRRAAIDVEPLAALAAWWEELVIFAESALSKKSLSTHLPDLALLLSEEESTVCGSGHSFSAAAMRAAAEAAASCNSRLQSTFPLLCGAAVRSATVGLIAVAKAFLTISVAARSSPNCGLSLKAVGETGLCSSERSLASSPNVVLQLRMGTTSFPSLPFAALTSSTLYDAVGALQPVRRVQWLLLWLHAESAAATAAEVSGSRRAGRQVTSALSIVGSFSSFSGGARLVLAGLLEQLAQRHLAWRQQQEIAADQTASLLQRLEGLVVDRAGQGRSRANAEAAEELFPCADEWGVLKKDKQQQQVLQEEATNDDGTTQYTAWCRQDPQGAEDCHLQKVGEEDEQLDGLSEADLLLLWERAVETGNSWSGNSTSREADVEAAATAMYREALTFLVVCVLGACWPPQGSLCILLELHNAQPQEAMKSSANAKPPAAVVFATAHEELSAPAELDVACAPHLQALLTQMSARLVDESPLRQQQEEQQLKQLLLLQEEEAAVAADPGQQAASDPAALEERSDTKDLEQQLQQERLQQQRERARKLSFAQLCRRMALSASSSGRSTSTGATSFYAPGNAALLQPLGRPVQQLQEAAASFAEVVEDHPALQSLLLLAQRVSSLSLSATSPADALTALEGLLDRAAAWQNAMDRHHLAHLVSLHCERQSSTTGSAGGPNQHRDKHGTSHIQAEAEAEKSGVRHSAMAAMEQQVLAAMHAAERLLERFDVAVGAVERQVLLLRRRQLVEWRFLRDFREERMHRQSLRFAPFLWVLLPDDGDAARPPQIAAAEAAAAAAASSLNDSFSGGSSHEAAGTVLLRLIGAAPVAVADVLIRFLRTSPLGQFEGRLQCMEAASLCRRMLLQTAQQAETKREFKEKNEAGNAAEGAAVVAVAMGAVARFAVAAGWRRAVQQQLQMGRKEMDREEQLVAASLALPLRSPLAVARQAVAEDYDGFQQQDRHRSPQGETTPNALAAAASVNAVQDFLQQIIPGLIARGSPVQSSSLADFHAFSLNSASVSDIAIEVQAVCQEFAAAVKEASAAAAREIEKQQQQQGEQRDAGMANSESRKKKPAVSRQQIQRRFADLRSMLRFTLKLPCLSTCGGAPGLLAAALNDASGLPDATPSSHPLRDAAGLQQHDTAAAAAASLCASRRLAQASKTKICADEGAVRATIGKLLGGVWSSAAQQWYLMLQTLLQCQQLASPHKDVVAHRDTLLGYAAALVLHILQQRNRCWRAAAEFQDLVDAVSLCLTGPSAQVCAEKVVRLLTAAETFQEGLRQASALLPSEREAAVQNDALAGISPPRHELVNGTAAPLGALASHGAFRSPASLGTAPEEQHEHRLLQHNLKELQEVHRSIKNALKALQPVLHLLRETPEGRWLTTARGEETVEHVRKRQSIRVRLQWVRDVEDACASALQCLEAALSSQLLPSHATRGLRRVCDTLSSSCVALIENVEAARRDADSAANVQALASSVESFERSLEAIAADVGSSPQPDCGRDRLLQVATHPQTEDDNGDLQRQPIFDALPVPPLSGLFPFEDIISALRTFDEAAPSYIPEGVLVQQRRGTTKAATTALHMLQRAAGVLLSAFDGLEGTARIGLSLMQLVLVLLQLGWGCLSNEEEEAAAAAGRQPQKEKDEWVSGTGLGEGEGLRDGSEQIEEEWQFDGLRDEKQDPQQRPPEKPKSEEEDKALEVSMDFDGEATAPPPKEQDGQQQQQWKEEAQQDLDDVAGSVDLQQGGEIEDKRWAGLDENKKDEEGNGPDSKTQKQVEDIQTEGGIRQGGVEMEGNKDDHDDGPHKTKSKLDDEQNRQQVKDEMRHAEEELMEDGGKLEVDGEEEQSRPDYQKKLQRENPILSEEETLEDAGEETVEADDAGEEGEEAGDSADARAEQQRQQQERQQVRGEGITEGWGEDLQLEDGDILDGAAGEDEEGADDGAVEAPDELAPKDDGPKDEDAPAVTSELGGVGETEGDDEHRQRQQQQEGPDRESEQADDSDKATTAEDNGAADGHDHAREEKEESHEDAQEEKREEERDGREEDFRQDPSVQAPVNDTKEPEDDDSQADTQKKQLPSRREDRQRMAFGVEGEGRAELAAGGSVLVYWFAFATCNAVRKRDAVCVTCSPVQRELFEGDDDNNEATGEHAALSDEQQNGTGAAAAAATAGGDSLAQNDANSSQHSQAPSSSKQLPPNMLPENPLEDDSAVERWLQRVRLLHQGEEQPDENAGGGTDVEHPEQMDVEGGGGEASGECRDEGVAPEEQSKNLQRGQLCQKDDAAGSQEAFAETSDAAATKPTPNAKLADANDHGCLSSAERILSTLSRGEALEEACEDEKDKNTLPAVEADGDSISADGEAEEGEAEASAQLYRDLAIEPDTGKDLELKQRDDKPELVAAKAQKEDYALGDEEERMEAMAAELEERMALDDVGKEGLSPERAAALWHLLENRTAASAAALSESLRLVLQPTAIRGWEGGYRSGKKLSLRRVLAFVASSQRDDRLWLRRRRPQGLQYRVLVGIDCSRSMQQLNAAASALEAVVLLAQTFNHLQIGTVSVCTFGGPKPEVCVHPTPQLSAADGQLLVQRCSFREESHKSHEVAISDLLQLAIHELEKDSSSSSNSNSMILILSDGRFNKEVTRPWVHAAIARRCIPLLLILDPQHPRGGGSSSAAANDAETAAAASAAAEVKATEHACAAHSSSIFDLKQVQQQPGGGLQVTPYLQDFPFPYYAVVNDAQQLPSVLADVLRQWVEAAANDW
ncbi:hypothetical protein Emag_001907 [Eimeria magna]